MRVAKKKEPTGTSWKPTAEDYKLIDDLKAKTGIMNGSDLMRLALRRLAEAEGLSKAS